MFSTDDLITEHWLGSFPEVPLRSARVGEVMRDHCENAIGQDRGGRSNTPDLRHHERSVCLVTRLVSQTSSMPCSTIYVSGGDQVALDAAKRADDEFGRSYDREPLQGYPPRSQGHHRGSWQLRCRQWLERVLCLDASRPISAELMLPDDQRGPDLHSPNWRHHDYRRST